MNREEKGGRVEGNLDQEGEGRETCKLYCEEAFKQRRELANILMTEKTQKGMYRSKIAGQQDLKKK